MLGFHLESRLTAVPQGGRLMANWMQLFQQRVAALTEERMSNAWFEAVEKILEDLSLPR
ncbi:MAG TPA: hypothetical protein VHE35_22505 [Kofleriaceae bacterium]|nr:hypothetical protein [Kofleriaceae bacterium]